MAFVFQGILFKTIFKSGFKSTRIWNNLKTFRILIIIFFSKPPLEREICSTLFCSNFTLLTKQTDGLLGPIRNPPSLEEYNYEFFISNIDYSLLKKIIEWVQTKYVVLPLNCCCRRKTIQSSNSEAYLKFYKVKIIFEYVKTASDWTLFKTIIIKIWSKIPSYNG